MRGLGFFKVSGTGAGLSSRPVTSSPSPETGSPPPRSIDALWRGFQRRCPRCGKGGLLESFLRVRSHCSHCGLDIGSYRSDDAPPYFTIVIVGHLIVPLVLIVEKWLAPELWIQMAIWVPLTLLLTLALLPRVKGAVIGWQWAIGVRG